MTVTDRLEKAGGYFGGLRTLPSSRGCEHFQRAQADATPAPRHGTPGHQQVADAPPVSRGALR